MNSIARRVAPFAAIAVLGSMLVTGPARSEPKEWDQDRVLMLARLMNYEVVKMKDDIAKARETADPKSARWIVLDDLMHLQHRVVVFEALISAGEGREATAPVFRRVRNALKQARRDAPAFPEIERQRKHISSLNTAVDKIAVFYVSK